VNVTPPSDSELAWLEESVARACAMAVEYAGAAPGAMPTAAQLDVVWAKASELLRDNGDDPNVFINIIGLTFGQLLSTALQLNWAVVTDEHGTDLALHHAMPEIVLFPTNLVAKRWVSRETGFIAPLYEQLVGDIRRILGRRS
jgi:hypothetical protein